MNHRFSLSLASLALAAGILSACGGGGSSTPATVATASVSGTAATGAAIAAGTVTLKCVSGTATAATTGTDGSFTIDVTSVTLPCVGRVDYKDATGAAQKLHTFISGTGTANITPVTELLVASLTGGTAADAFDKFDATKAKAITAGQIKTAADTVKSYLKNTLGVDTTNLPDDPVGTKLTAKTGSAAGDKADAVLDALAASLKSSSKKLSDLVGDIGKGTTGGGTSGGTTTAGTGSLVVSAATVSARNGSYKVDGGRFADGTNFGVNGSTTDGNFEAEAKVASNGSVIYAQVWYFVGSKIIFFGCGSSGVACTGVSYEPVGGQVMISNATWFSSSTGQIASSLTSGGESITISGSLVIPK
jgi:hypothetical protein